MKIVTDKKEIKEIIKVIYEINQMFKSIYQNKGYYIFDDEEVYSYDKEQFPICVIGYLNSLAIKTKFFKGKKFIIRGKEFYDFDPKKTNKSTREIEIDKIIYDENNNSIEFTKDLLSLKFEIDSNNNESFYDPYPKFHREYINCENNEDDYNDNYRIKLETLVNIKNGTDSIAIKLDDSINEAYVIDKDKIDLKNDKIIYLNNKFIIGNIVKKDKSQCYDAIIETYTNINNKNIKLAVLSLYNNLFTISNFYHHLDSRN